MFIFILNSFILYRPNDIGTIIAIVYVGDMISVGINQHYWILHSKPRKIMQQGIWGY